MTEPDPHWFERVKALGAAQARYLWLLLILMLFYPALHMQAASSPGQATAAQLPFVGLAISSAVILASGPAVLSVVVLAIVGSMRALRRAREQGLGGATGEEFDLHPNVIDLAFYAPPGAAPFFVHFASSAYAIFLSLGFAEGCWLWASMMDGRLPTWYAVIVTVIGTLLLGRSLWLLVSIWEACIRNYRTLRKPRAG